MDYILGRNPLAQSYVSGYGTYAMHNPHHRVWAHQKNPALPEAPPGAVAGGPNSALQNPYIREAGPRGLPARRPATSTTSSRTRPTRWQSTGTPRSPGPTAFLDDVGTDLGKNVGARQTTASH